MDLLGKVLLANGSLTAELLSDVLEEQRRNIPIGSMCYILGILDEETLARALSRQYGMPSVVLDRTVIPLDVLGAVPREVALQKRILPLHEDQQRIFVAAEEPRRISDTLREIRFVRGKMPVVHLALQIPLARTIRAAYKSRDAGLRLYAGPRAERDGPGVRAHMHIISDFDSGASMTPGWSAVEDVTKELSPLDLEEFAEMADDDASHTVEVLAFNPAATGVEVGPDVTAEIDPHADGVADTTSVTRPDVIAVPPAEFAPASRRSRDSLPGLDSMPSMLARPGPRPVVDLDAGPASAAPIRDGARHVLIVDDDFATRHLLVKVLQSAGIATATAATGGQAIRALKSNPPDVIILDVMLPEMDGFQICQSIKQSRKYNHIGVLLMSAVISSERVTADIRKRYGVEGYYEKPIDTDAIKQRVEELLRATESDGLATADDSFDRAMVAYKSGQLNKAIEILRSGLDIDPLSPKHHFVLANLLQKKNLIYEAIEAYETTVELKPDYFPALTRLAYLYYKKGFAAKAAEVWKRSLQYCTDDALRQNIEEFIASLRAEMIPYG